MKIPIILIMTISMLGCHPHGLIKTKSDLCPGLEDQGHGVAVIKGDGHWIPWGLSFVQTTSLAGIHMVDGKALKADQPGFFPSRYYWSCCDVDEVRVPPGPHEVMVRLSKWSAIYYPLPPPLYSGGEEKLTGTLLLTFNFDTKAGHIYKIRIPNYWSKGAVIEVVDEETKEVVASQVVD